MIKIALEGMPGAGKTSALAYAAQYLSSQDVMLLPEVNPKRSILIKELHCDTSVYHNLWKERINVIKSSSTDYVLLFDRTYFTNLAFIYGAKSSLEFQAQKSIILKEFEHQFFDLIIVLSVTPSVGMERRLLNSDYPPFPWNELPFLERLNFFYKEELSKIYDGKLIIIETTNYSQVDTYSHIMLRLREFLSQSNWFRKEKSPLKLDRKSISTLLSYANREQLGRPYTSVMDVLGFPTIYFRQYALQLDNGSPTYLDNERLSYLLNTGKNNIYSQCSLRIN